MKKMRFIRFVGACLLGVTLVACQDKFAQVDDSLPKAEPKAESEGGVVIGEDFIPFMETEMQLSEDEQDQLRSVGMDFVGPEDQKGLPKIRSPRLRFTYLKYTQNPATKKWSSEEVVNPNMNVDILLRRQKGEQINFIRERGIAQFIGKPEESRRKARVRIWIKQPNPKKSKSLFTFESDETWYAMLILDAEAGALTDESGKEVAIFGESPAARSSLINTNESIITFVGNNQGAGTSAKGARRGAPAAIDRTNSPGRQEIPLVSNWQKLVLSDSNGNPKLNEGRPDVLVRLAESRAFTIKPQGLLLNYQITANVYEGVDMRRAGIVSNVLDFQGKYKLDEESLKAAFEKSGGGNGFGIPAWEPIKSKLKEFQALMMYKAPAENLQFGFPWDMPMISDRFTETQVGATPAMRMSATTMPDSDVAMVLFGGSEASQEYQNQLSGIKIGLTTPRKNLTKDAPGNYWDVVYHVQWAMPKEQVPAASERFTYFWMDAHSAHSEEEYFNARVSSINPSSPETSGKYIDFIQQRGPRTQPMVVVHQTNADFTSQTGKTPRLYATLSADLMITELVYRVEGGKNFSVVELQNPSRLPIDLNDYALVRLISNGSKMQYRMSNGQGTDNLDHAEFFCLQNLDKKQMVGDYRDTDEKYTADGPGSFTEDQYGDWYTGEYMGDYKRPYHQFETDGQKRLEAGQIVLLGSPCYTQYNPTTQPWWSQFFPVNPRKSIWYDLQKRFRYFIGCNTQVLNINSENKGGVGDGLALVKFFDKGSSKHFDVKTTKKKVVDTTAPIGSSNFGFSGTFESYKNQYLHSSNPKSKEGGSTNSNYYTQKRKDGVVFPFMAPYRTVKTTSKWSDDWDLVMGPASYTGIDGELTGEQQTLGHRWLASLDGAKYQIAGERKNLRLSRGRYFVKGRTLLGKPDLYKQSRPVHR
ncbi:hypothetical protein [Porphyromonas sp. COT-290 OH860]|uniref:hypothetical protein n=1 Tax=Porphyromonas sp. COT-290 OH860 TaxID=1515615 RepID=UPI001269F7DC|nr:hypothetical protein [Porphyromonas sp. COT-290 OH860]